MMGKAKENCAEVLRMKNELILCTRPQKKLVRNVKGRPVRKLSETLCADDIDALHAAWES